MADQMNPKVREAMRYVERVLLNHIGPCFIPEARITLLVRIPGNDAANVMLTTDTKDAAVAALAGQFDVKDAQDEVRRDPLFQPCCANEKRSNGGCVSCGDPCL